MRIFIALFALLAVLLTVTADIAHAHIGDNGAEHAVVSVLDDAGASECTDAGCGGCAAGYHFHFVVFDGVTFGYAKPVLPVFWLNTAFDAGPVYGVIRPPKA